MGGVVFGELGFGVIAGGNGKYAGVDGLGAFNVGGGVSDDEDFGWVEVGKLFASIIKCSPGDVVAVFGGVPESAKFKAMPKVVVGKFEFCAERKVAGEQAKHGGRGHGFNGIKQL